MNRLLATELFKTCPHYFIVPIPCFRFCPIFCPSQIQGHYSFQLLKVLARLTLWFSKCLNVWILFCTKIKWEIIGSQKYDVQKRSSYSSSHTDFTSSPFIFSLWHMFEPFLPSQSEKNLKWRGKSKWIIHNCSKPTHSPFNFFTQKSFFVLLHNSKVSTLRQDSF